MFPSDKITTAKPYIVFVSLLSVFIIGIVDYLTGVELNIAIFYLLPISVVTWFAGRREGIFLSSLAAIVWLSTDVFLVESHYSYTAIPFWNAIMRGGVFIIVVFLLSRLKVALIHEKETSRIKSNMLSLVSHLNLAMTSTLDLHTVGKSVLETIELLFPGCASTIRLLNRETGDLQPLASCNLDEDAWTAELPKSPLAREVLEIMAPLIVRNVQTDSRTQNIEFFRRHGLVSYLGLPLTARGDLLGIISLYNKHEHDFTNEEVAFFTTLGGQAAIALQNARLFEEVRAGHVQLRDLSRRLLEVQEAEHRHIARELHDEIGQILTGLKLTLELSGRLSTQEASVKLAEAQALLDDLITRTRRLSLDLRPSMLDDLGLFPALRWHFERYSSVTQVNVTFNHSGLEGKRFAPQLETAAYRIVQEAMTNVARHSGVKQVMIDVCSDQDTLTIEIEDKGVGFDPGAAMRAGKASGLTGVRERTMLLGGRLKLESAPGTGTSLTVEFPLAESPQKDGAQWMK
jgi:signal transduction histidine kinase